MSILDKAWIDIDGRYFRDNKWNYDALFEIAKKQDKELYDEYEKALEQISFYAF